jgi:hypothetical protein
MGKATAQAAAGMGREEIDKALDVLRLLWDGEYSVGHDDEHGWWATRDGVIGRIITAAGPEELNEMMAAESGAGR